MSKLKIIKILVIFSSCIFILGEIVGHYYGLASFPLFISDPDFEYISAPNQDKYIYHNHFVTNEYSQRSKQISKNDSLIGLLIGDSVIYGGNSIDQDMIASTLLEKSLSTNNLKGVRILNISSKSWGPDNAAAYIKKYGTFKAKKIILVVSSHDAYDNMDFKKVVGLKSSHPDKNSISAWPMILQKGLPILIEKFGIRQIGLDSSILKKSEKFNTGFEFFKKLSLEKNISFTIYLHKSVNEIKTGKLEEGGDEIREYCKINKIELIEGKEELNMYLDGIHFNERGQEFLKNVLLPRFEKVLFHYTL